MAGHRFSRRRAMKIALEPVGIGLSPFHRISFEYSRGSVHCRRFHVSGVALEKIMRENKQFIGFQFRNDMKGEAVWFHRQRRSRHYCRREGSRLIDIYDREFSESCISSLGGEKIPPGDDMREVRLALFRILASQFLSVRRPASMSGFLRVAIADGGMSSHGTRPARCMRNYLSMTMRRKWHDVFHS